MEPRLLNCSFADMPRDPLRGCYESERAYMIQFLNIATYQYDLLMSYAIERQDEQEEENGQDAKAFDCASYDAVVPGEYGKLIQSCDKIPTSSDVTGDKDADRQYGKRLHRTRRWY
jgi:hypothetical protein